MNIQPGVVVQAMVLDTLSGRSPLYRLKEFLIGQDVELLVGEDLSPDVFTDVNVGRSLDAISRLVQAELSRNLVLERPIYLHWTPVLRATTLLQPVFGVITETAKMMFLLLDPLLHLDTAKMNDQI